MDGLEHLRTLCEEAARGRFPPPTWGVDVVPPPPRVAGAVVAFTAHHVIAAEIAREEIDEKLDPDDIAAPFNPMFLAWLGRRLNARVGHIDAVLARLGTGGGADGSGDLVLVQTDAPSDSERVRRARRLRSEVRFYEPEKGGAVVTLGRGLAGRLELAIEIASEMRRGSGLGTSLLRAAVATVPADTAVFASISPGNTRSLRAALAAGFTPIGAEVFFPSRGGEGMSA